jgi:hypothetical protein
MPQVMLTRPNHAVASLDQAAIKGKALLVRIAHPGRHIVQSGVCRISVKQQKRPL